ncbi:hypothetical protein ACFRCI_46935 [Streptomyces sp. NPDC056638]|uniref:hypothetical protein n=1 Tax=Streptomyces sp. NPDC056638 TaxID=3345887 RepID=UPI0036C623E7
MKTESTDIMPCYCWDKNPKGRGCCTQKPGHKDDHYDPYAVPRGPGRAPRGRTDDSRSQLTIAPTGCARDNCLPDADSTRKR